MPDRKPFVFGEGTMEAFASLRHSDSLTTESRWKTKYPLTTAALPTLDRGLLLLAAEENAGKSNLAGEIYTGVLDNTEGSVVVDFVLDDSREDRMRALVASRSRLSMTDVQIAGAIPEGDPRLDYRAWAYQDLISRYDGRLAILDGECLAGKGGVVKHIIDHIGDVRSLYPDRPLWVSVDAFDDVSPGLDMEDLSAVSHVAKALKDASKRFDCVVMATKHLVKGSGRDAGTDSMRGYSSLKYHARAVLLGYNEVASLGDEALVYHSREDRPGVKCPVFEVRFRKNKAGDFKGLVCFLQYQEQYRSEEASVSEQRAYRDLIGAEARKKRARKDG